LVDLRKPDDVFDRDSEWNALAAFVASPAAGATLGLVYGRRRQGKTYLLQALAEATGGFYGAALRLAGLQNRERLAAAYQAYRGDPVAPRFDTWSQALTALLALGDGSPEPKVVILDEFPYLLEESMELGSLLQDLLAPRREAALRWRTRLILCGSALSTMQALLTGTAPLRGRAALELSLHPLEYREAAKFWGATDPAVAVRLHALVGGTAGYREMAGGTGPSRISAFDRWVGNHLLNPASAMFREGTVLVAEEERVTDASVYFAVLAAISARHTRRGEIAAAVGKSEGALAHPINVLVESRLVERLADALKQKRTTYHIAEPVLRLHQLLIAPYESRLVRYQGERVWTEAAGTVSSQIYGPHFEHLARTWCEQHASEATLGGYASHVGPTVVSCPLHRANHEVDVVVVGAGHQPGSRVMAIGEAKWRHASPVDMSVLARLEHVRELLGLDRACKLLAFSSAGFGDDLIRASQERDDVELVDLNRLYRGS
jgi:uncharacterized protein